MDQSGIHIGDVGKLLRHVVDDWRLDQRKRTRSRRKDFEDHFDRLDGREDQAGTERLRAELQDSLDLYNSQLDSKYAMIEEAHRQMVEHLERCKQGAQ